MAKIMLKDGDRCYSTGAWLIYHTKGNYFSFDGWEDETFFNGEYVEVDENGKPYIEKDTEEEN